ncbi:hypothetical protein, variant [Saprolegnia diclina VS20]|uniref:Uncharacterized protein n=1 Tax=Saprolegnia diclina (strain VS20) TaxID=1156394 RepID=T0QUQ1_SAPDV|nr:hypothetical protein, variant [Saprolegnia diclina VS20]EQC41929.1 hypothetical protein, variant [Saprolegnia diclina VS20]|eukprot:XP_008604497.1 hypothetical protein, variant [Saprolegnia diclina VS20]
MTCTTSCSPTSSCGRRSRRRRSFSFGGWIWSAAAPSGRPSRCCMVVHGPCIRWLSSTQRKARSDSGPSLLEMMLREANAAMKKLVHPDTLVTISIANMCSEPVVVDAVSICFVHNGRLLESTIELHEVLGVSATSSRASFHFCVLCRVLTARAVHLGVHLGNLASRPSTNRCSRMLEPLEALPVVTWRVDGGHCIAGLHATVDSSFAI